MRLLPEALRVTAGAIKLDGQELNTLSESSMRAVRGGRAGMIFQEPATSLNPVMRIGEQILEPIYTHTALRGNEARARAIQWLSRVGSQTQRCVWMIILSSFLADKSSGS